MQLSRQTLITATALAVAMALQLLAFKVLKVLSVVPLISVRGSGSIAVLGALLLAGLVGLRPWNSLSPRYRLRLMVSTAVLVGCALATLGIYSHRPLRAAGTAFELARADLLFASLFLVAGCVLLQLPHFRIRRLAVAGLYGAAFAATFVSALDLGFFLSTGSLGDWHLLAHSARHGRDVFGAVASEIRGVNVALLCVPLVTMLAAVLIPRLGAVRRWAAAGAAHGRAPLWWAVALPLCLALFPTLRALPRYRPYTGSPFTERLRDLHAVFASPPGGAPIDVEPSPFFDTAALRLVATPRQQALNVVVLILESTGARATTVHDPQLATTPFLAELAARSVVLDHFYAMVPHTSKALVAILCGIPPKITLAIAESEPGGIPGRCLPALLSDIGYATAAFTGARLSFENNAQLFDNMGFQLVRGEEHFRDDGFEALGYVGLDDRAVLQPSLDWIDAVRREGRPFLVTYMTVAGHHPYVISASFPSQRYERAVNTRQEQYFNALRQRDDFVRDLVRGFEQRGLLESTLVIVLGDHGEAFGEHGRFLHDSVPWDEVLHIPGLITGAGVVGEPRRIGGLRQQIDLLPTIANALGFDVAGGRLPGYDLLAPVPDDRRLYFSSWYGNHWLASRQGALKRIYHYRRFPFELYDLDRDPLERANIADATAAHTAEIHLLQWAASVNRVYR